MQHNLDLRNTRCPLALVLLKQKLLILDLNDSISIEFVTSDAIRDILLYLDKKNYCYRFENKKLLVFVNH
jgi:TusA-related sulfurtransferase